MGTVHLGLLGGTVRRGAYHICHLALIELVETASFYHIYHLNLGGVDAGDKVLKRGEGSGRAGGDDAGGKFGVDTCNT